MVLRALGFALSLFFSVVATQSVVAQVADVALPAPLTDSISDYADVLDATAEGRIQRLLEQTLAETGVGVQVVTMPDITLYGGAGMRLEAYAKALLTAWDTQDPTRGDSVLVLVVTEAREARIALGSGYDAVYDKRAARILSSAVLPELRKDQIAGALEAGIFLIRDRLILPFQSGQPVGVDDGFAPDPDTVDTLFGLAAFAGIAGTVVFLILHSRRKRKTCPHCGAATLTRSHEVIERATGSSTGTGLEHRLCTGCGYTDRRTYTLGRLRPGLRNSGGTSGGLSDSLDPLLSASRAPGGGIRARWGGTSFGGDDGGKV
jgi:uncharacterized protein